MPIRQVPYRVEDGRGSVVEEGFRSVDVSTEQINDETLRQQAAAALATNRTYIARSSPTAAQQTAQIKALSQQHNGIIRLLLGQLDGTD